MLRAQLRPAAAIGFVSFLFPAAGAFAYALFVAHWTLDGSKIAGVAMSTTSVAVVYAVMVESRLAPTEFGQLILAGCFITDLGTVVALGLLFANYNVWLVALIVGIAVAIAFVPRVCCARSSTPRRNASASRALRVLFTIILILAALATAAKSEGVLPAYFLGSACAGFLIAHPDIARRVRSWTMGFLTPFYFLKAGSLVSFSARARGVAADSRALRRENRPPRSAACGRRRARSAIRRSTRRTSR